MENTQKERSLAIIDDSVPLRDGVAKFMTTAGVKVLFAADNGRDGLEKFAASPEVPDACLLDIDMPVMDGFATAKEIKLHWPGVRVIMYSLYTDAWTERKAREVGADLVLSKSCEPHMLLKAIAG